MKRKKSPFINLFDVALILIIAAMIVLITVFVSPSGKTVVVEYTLTVTEGDAGALSSGDVLTVISGGVLGTVIRTDDKTITAAAEAERHAGRYYSGAASLIEDGEYVICVGTNKLVCTLHGITKR